jgi:hypothetical protein
MPKDILVLERTPSSSDESSLWRPFFFARQAARKDVPFQTALSDGKSDYSAPSNCISSSSAQPMKYCKSA